MKKIRIILFAVILMCMFECGCFGHLDMACAAIADTSVATIGDVGYDSLKQAIEEADDGDKITIVRNHTIDVISNTTSVFAINGKSIEIDLNGQEVLVNINCTITALFMTNEQSGNTGHLKLYDSSLDECGLIEILVTSSGSASNFVRNSNNCSVIIESGNYKMNKSENGAGMIDSRCDTIVDSNIGVFIYGGNFYLDNVGTLQNGSPWIINTSGQNEKGVCVAGGTFNDNINRQYYPFEVDFARDLALKNNNDGTWSVVPAVCYVEVQYKSGQWYLREEGFATIEDAVSIVDTSKYGVENGYGSVITIMQDCYTTRDRFIVPTDKEITIDLYAVIYLQDGFEIPNNVIVNLCGSESSIEVYIPEPEPGEPEPDEPSPGLPDTDDFESNDQIDNIPTTGEDPSKKTNSNDGANVITVLIIAGASSVAIGGGVSVYFFVIKKKLAKKEISIVKRKIKKPNKSK